MTATAHAPRPGRLIGLFGGSFDPVHQGHAALARCALTHLGLDELRWVPAGEAWQKARPLTPAVHREAMLRLAIEGEPRFAIERCELTRGGPSYTIDTVRALAAAEPTAQWVLVIGQDQYANFHTWREHAVLLSLVTLAVAAREGQPVQAEALAGLPHRHVVLPMPHVPVSSSAIRQRLARGEAPTMLAPDLISPAVAGYIARHGLYATPTGQPAGDPTPPPRS